MSKNKYKLEEILGPVVLPLGSRSYESHTNKKRTSSSPKKYSKNKNE